MRYALIKDGTVETVAEAASSDVFVPLADEDGQVPEHYYDEAVLLAEGFRVECGDRWDGKSFGPPVLTISVDDAKQMQYARIDQRTRGLISIGFEHRGMRFSLSTEAQANLSRLHQFADTLVSVRYPTIDNSAELVLADADEIRAFVLDAVSVVSDALRSGVEQKAAVRAYTTAAEVLAFADLR